MNLQGRNLSLRIRGNDVRVLHIELRKLGYTIPGQEYGRRNFGLFTRKAILDFQRKQNLPDNGVVDEATAKRINEAVDALAPAAEFVVQGQVTQRNRSIAGIMVKAFDKDLRSEELLGETATDGQGRYDIRYTAHQFRRGEKKRADLIVRVYSKEEVLLGESGIIFNAKPNETVDLKFELPEAVKPSEYEKLLDVLKPVLEELQPADLTKEDLAFILKELASEKIVTKLLLQLLADSARLARETRLPTEAFYGLARQLQFKPPLNLKMFLTLTKSACKATLQAAIKKNIIPRRLQDAIDSILGRLEQLKIENKLLVQRPLTGRILNEETGKSLVNFQVRASHQHGEEPRRDLGDDITDRRGRFAFTLTTLPPGAAETERLADRLTLTVLNARNEAIYETELEIRADQRDLPNIQVPASALPPPVVRPIREVASSLNLNLPKKLKDFLAEKKIESIEDIRRAGGLRRLKDLPLEDDHPTFKALEAQTNLSLLKTSVKENARLAEKGFISINAISSMPRKSFCAAMDDDMDARRVAQVHAMARAQQRMLDSILNDVRVDLANGRVPMALHRDVGAFGELLEDPAGHAIQEEFAGSCDCPDCEAAVSPTAYLADLLDYAVEHIKNGPGAHDFITLAELANLLYQPFGDLPASCEAVTRQVRQVRLCVEVLRQYVKSLPEVESRLEKDEKAYCFSAYKTLLVKLGTSYEELRLARTADVDTRRVLAERLGIDLPASRPDPLDALLLDPATIAEALLETLFGLVDTTRDPLSDGLTRGDSRQQISHWQLSGVEWNRNTDELGLIYVKLSNPSGSVYRVDLYSDEARSHLVATGQISSARGRVGLAERGHSGLFGSIDLNFRRETDAIVLVALPEVLSWRLRHLRTLWQAEDGVADPYTRRAVSPYTEADLLPVIDPDLIGPDDFRAPFEKTKDTDPNRPFDLWVRRRINVNGIYYKYRDYLQERLESETEVQISDVFIDLLEQLYSPAVIAERFEKLADNLARGREIDKTEQEIREQHRLTLESFLRLREIQAKTREQKRLAEEDWEEVISILVQAEKRDLFNRWRDEEDDLVGRIGHPLFSPRYFWDALREPVEGPWPLELPKDLPFIDPENIGLKELPEPTAGQRAIGLWHRRREELTQFADELRNQHSSRGINAILVTAFGDVPVGHSWLDYLADLLEKIKTVEVSGGEEPALDAELEALHLDREQLARLMDVLTGTEVTEADWAEAYALLTTLWKKRVKWPEWHEEEQNDPVLTDPDLGKRDWRFCKANLPKWRASVEDRQIWRQALQRRCRKPIIDPDLIGTDSLRDQTSGAAWKLWRNREHWINNQMAEIEGETVATPLARFDELLIDNLFEPTAVERNEAQLRALREASEGIEDFIRQALGVTRTVLENLLSDLGSPDAGVAGEAVKKVTEYYGFNLSAFQRLVNAVTNTVTDGDWNIVVRVLARANLVAHFASMNQEQEQGQAITDRLAQLNLTNASFSYLIRMRRLLASGAMLHETEWADVYSIFVQVRKSRAAAEWLEEERDATITLSPDHFQIPEPLPLQFPPPEEEPLPAWRTSQKDLRQWRNTLKARIEQAETTIAALQSAVSVVEEETLPALRNALIMASDVEGGNLTVKGKRLTDLLLIDMQSSGCQMTTRISQAIETVQGVLWSIRTGQLQDTYPDLALDADNFDGEWKWLGSYATWRAAIFVFLYPENILLPSLRIDQQTPAFIKLVDDLRSNRNLTAYDACMAAKEYADYFEDVCKMEVQATCYGKTRIQKTDPCGKHATPEMRNLFYMFGRGGKTGKVYWSALDPEDQLGYPQTFWEVVPGLEDVQVTKIVGSVPYTKTDEQRFIFLFLLVEKGGETKLLFTKYDLRLGGLDCEPTPLELPSYTLKNPESKIVAIQSDFISSSPKLAIVDHNDIGSVGHHAPSGMSVICVRGLNLDGTDWESSVETSSEDEWSYFKVCDCYFYGAVSLWSAILDKGNTLFLSFTSSTYGLMTTDSSLYVLKYFNFTEPPYDVFNSEEMQRSSWEISNGTWFGALPLPPVDDESKPWMIYGQDTDGKLRRVYTNDHITEGPGIFSPASGDVMRCSQIVPTLVHLEPMR